MERPAWVTNEEEWRGFCREIAARSRDLLESRLGIIEAARELHVLGHSVRAERDPDFITFTAIYSESDHLPVGSVRREWAVEQHWRDDAFTAARHLVEKYT